MKLLLLLLLPTLCFAQKISYTLNQLVPIDSVNGEIIYSGVVEVQGATATDLYSRAKTYFLKTFNNSNAVVEVDEKDSRVAGKGIFLLATSRKTGYFSPPQEYVATIEIRVKDGRYRYEFSQFMAHLPGITTRDIPILTVFKQYGRTLNERAADQIRVWDEGVLAQIAQLNKYMTSKSTSKDF